MLVVSWALSIAVIAVDDFVWVENYYHFGDYGYTDSSDRGIFRRLSTSSAKTVAQICGVLTVLLTSMNLCISGVLQLWAIKPPYKIHILWWILRVGCTLAVPMQAGTFVLLARYEDNWEELGSGGIMAIVNIFFLLSIAIMLWLVGPSNNPVYSRDKNININRASLSGAMPTQGLVPQQQLQHQLQQPYNTDLELSC